MKLTDSDLLLLAQYAITAARQAGQIINQYSHRPITVKTKAGGTSLASQVVTEVDHLCQDVILQTLIPTCETFDLALLSEETPDDLKRLKKDYFWCIDPLDGTLPFIESTPGYAVSIALVARDGNPHIGIIYDPVEQTLYHAIKGQGAFRNGKPWILKPSSPKQSLTFIADRSFKQHSSFSETLAELQNLAATMGYKGCNTILYGGAVMNACWVLEKLPACYFKFPKPEAGGGSLWDYAATACLFLEAGAITSDINGAPLDLNRPDSTFMNHNGVLYASDQMLAEQIMDLYKKAL
jgi:3'(2'), 5'-bisphosphate nucleotidase/myo-inositol-1(or 4)-monophosphatase